VVEALGAVEVVDRGAGLVAVAVAVVVVVVDRGASIREVKVVGQAGVAAGVANVIDRIEGFVVVGRETAAVVGVVVRVGGFVDVRRVAVVGRVVEVAVERRGASGRVLRGVVARSSS
jgi:hypothetical protein